jgi:hypothetical protein
MPKPLLVHHSANLWPLKGYKKDLLAVYVYSNPKGWKKSKVFCNYCTLKLE